VGGEEFFVLAVESLGQGIYHDQLALEDLDLLFGRFCLPSGGIWITLA
jgi:hypothetical protein